MDPSPEVTMWRDVGLQVLDDGFRVWLCCFVSSHRFAQGHQGSPSAHDANQFEKFFVSHVCGDPDCPVRSGTTKVSLCSVPSSSGGRGLTEYIKMQHTERGCSGCHRNSASFAWITTQNSRQADVLPDGDIIAVGVKRFRARKCCPVKCMHECFLGKSVSMRRQLVSAYTWISAIACTSLVASNVSVSKECCSSQLSASGFHVTWPGR